MRKLHWFRQAVWFTGCLAALIASGAAFAVWISPTWCRWMGVYTLAYPVLLGAAIPLCLLSLVAWRKKGWLPVVLLLPALYALRTYVPIQLSTPSLPNKSLRVMTYNVLSWGWHKKDSNGHLVVLKDILSFKPDIVCLQEAYFDDKIWKESMLPLLRPYGLVHVGFVQMMNERVAVLSRFPVVEQGRIEMPGKDNGAAWFRLCRAKGDTLLVVSAHLQSIGLSTNERETYSELSRGKEKEALTEARQTSRTILSKIATASTIRAEQAQCLHTFLQAHKNEKIILGGDFNDTPVSYAHHMVERSLTDAFRMAGNGLGRSFNRYRMAVRIDHLFCSEHFVPYHARIVPISHLSDHYPLVVDLSEN